jgi:uncharacterized protein (TIGR03435 family)
MNRRTVWLAGAVSGSVLCGVLLSATQASQTGGDLPRFEAVSVKPCDPDADAGGARSAARPSPNRLLFPCFTARQLIRTAFLPGQNPRDLERLVGGPSWMTSERFTLEAIADTSVPRQMVAGPMFQALLVDRFGLKLRRESRQVSAYALSIAPRGTTLAALRENDCVQSQSPKPPRPRKPDCDMVTRAATEPALTLSRLLERFGQAWVETRGSDRVFHALPLTMDGLALFLDSILDRAVINGTGLKGVFEIRLEFSPEGTIPAVDPALLAADPPRAPSIFTALQEQLGLRLEPGQAPGEVIVIESIDRPKPN